MLRFIATRPSPKRTTQSNNQPALHTKRYASASTDTQPQQQIEIQDRSSNNANKGALEQRGDRRRDDRRVAMRGNRSPFGGLDRMMDDFFGDMMPSVTRWDALSSPMDRTLRKAFRDMERNLPAVQGFDWSPTADITETKDSYQIEAHLPGVKKDNIKIDVDHNMLTIRGERKEEREENQDDTRMYRKESVYGTFMRTWTLPEDFDPKKIKANYKDGVLHLTIPKPPQSEAVQVPIEEESK